MEQIKTKLQQLRHGAMATHLAQHHQHAQDQQLSRIEFLELLIEEELALRQSKSYQRRRKQSGLNEQKRLDNYQFSQQPDLDRSLVRELAHCRFIQTHHNIVLMGKPGVGKTHLANALGLQALEKGHTVSFLHAHQLFGLLHRSRADDSYDKLLNKLIKTELLIIDELGFKKLPPHGADDFFELVSRRYEKGSIILTTNRNFQDWGKLLGDQVIASATIDRIVHHVHLIKIMGESYRIKNLGSLLARPGQQAPDSQ